MTRSKTVHQLVTFALFAYNQEAFIREAVEGAFSQTYDPLEIILSDDCSTDRTFEIMQEMAAEYRGPHRVRVVRNERNLGLVPHFLLRCREANGDIVVVAAGDDISYPNRVTKHVDAYGDEKVWAVSGGFDLIDTHGNLVSTGNVRPIGLAGGKKPVSYLKLTPNDYVVIQGSTASYRTDVFSVPLPDTEIIFSEDNLFNFLIYAHLRRVAFLEDPLIKYRAHAAALSNRGAHRLSVQESEQGSRAAALKDINKVIVFRWVAEKQGGDHFDFTLMESSLKRSEAVLNWSTLSEAGRILSLFRDIASGRREQIKWKAFRCFGRFPNYQPKKALSLFQKKYR